VDVSELKNIPLFADVPDDKLLKVATFASLESAVEGKVIIREGGAANAFYAIEEGTALLEKSERGATVTATSPVRMIKIDHWEIPRIRQSMPEVLEELQRKVEERSQ
jgi:hypothetical protein